MKAVVFVLATFLLVCIAATGQGEGGLQDSDTLYRTKCSSCHRVYLPKEHTYQKFQRYVAWYGKGLNDDEPQRLLEYLKENAKQETMEGGVTGNN